MRHSIECGQRLIAKKETLKRGEWLPWLEQNADVLGFDSPRTAQILIKGASNTKLASHLDEASAVALSRKLWGNDNTRGTQGTGENEWYTPADIHCGCAPGAWRHRSLILRRANRAQLDFFLEILSEFAQT